MPDPTRAPGGAEPPSSSSPSARGLYVYDEEAGKFGTVADVWATGLVFLRPIGGGLEWHSHQDHIRPALASEVLAGRVRAERKARTWL